MQRNEASDTCVRPRERSMELSLGTPSRFTWEEHISFGCLYEPVLLDGIVATWTTTTVVPSSREEPWNLRIFSSTLETNHFHNAFPSPFKLLTGQGRNMPMQSIHDLRV